MNLNPVPPSVSVSRKRHRDRFQVRNTAVIGQVRKRSKSCSRPAPNVLSPGPRYSPGIRSLLRPPAAAIRAAGIENPTLCCSGSTENPVEILPNP
jgi:hypothetical protein